MKRLKLFLDTIDSRKKRFFKPFLGVLVGGILGYGYYAFVGCSSGHCPITSNPMISTFWGALIGGLSAA